MIGWPTPCASSASRVAAPNPPTIGLMLGAVVWTWWIAVPLVAGSILAVVATIIGYVMKVQSLKYPKNR